MSDADDTPSTPRADALYERFQQLGTRFVDEFATTIPRVAYDVGPGVNVMYRSGKKDPATLRKPSKPIDYIHELEGGVRVYRCDTTSGKRIQVPSWITDLDDGKHDGLALLGECLGFAYGDKDDPTEARVRRPYPKLFAHPTGHALLVVDYQQQRILAMIWGGSLRVEARGICG